MAKAHPIVESLVVSALALGLYVPFLSIQYDPNGLIEVMSVEKGPLLNKNHMLFRPIGLLVWRALRAAGYSSNSLRVLQAIAAVAGGLGVGFAFEAFKQLSGNRSAGLAGAGFLAISFTYWVCSTDVFYITMAGMFAAAALACVVHATSDRSLLTAGVLAALSILTWQGSLFLIPALLLVLPKCYRSIRGAVLLICSAGLVAAVAYLGLALETSGVTGPREFWTWFTSYSENGTLPIWGMWAPDRFPTAVWSGWDSITAIRLAAGIPELFKHIQWGRIAVDFSVVAFTILLILAIIKPRLNALLLLSGYLCFLPFIVWWDPGSHKWFLVPNLFLAGFLACGLAPWIRYRYAQGLVLGCLLTIAAANFITTIRPRHFDIGPDRRIADCVAGHMTPSDMFVASDWGWPDYLPYLHQRQTINIINEFARLQNTERTLESVHEAVSEKQKEGGVTYMSDPGSQSSNHLQWLEASTGLTLKHLSSFAGGPSFVCDGVGILQIN
jgi:hypothetical protein